MWGTISCQYLNAQLVGTLMHYLPTNGSTHWQIMTDIKKIIDQQIAQQRRGGQDISVIEVDLPAIPDVGPGIQGHETR